MTTNDISFYIEIYDILCNFNNEHRLNEYFKTQFGFNSFFSKKEKIDEFKLFLKNLINNQKRIEFKHQDLGDFQTPSEFSLEICKFISNQNIYPEILIEPTCGTGNFVIAALEKISTIKYLYCVEIQPKYEWIFKLRLIRFLKTHNKKIIIDFYRENIFTHEFSQNLLEYLGEKKFLILGNPPWITNSELEKLGSKNLPKKTNFKKFKGIDSITGKSNFDIAEYIIYHLISKFDTLNGYIIMLCKNTVIRNIIKENPKLKLKIGKIQQFNFNSKKIFNIHANASLFLAEFNNSPEYICKSSNLSNPKNFIQFGWYNGKFVSDIVKYKKTEKFDGEFSFEWRQGLKHDLSRIMVLKKIDNTNYSNGNKEELCLEEELIYPFLKSSDLINKVVEKSRFYTIVPQKKVGQDTSYIKKEYPKTWDYLNNNIDSFRKRKSSIYRNKPDFSIFGIGKYSFAKYKIGVSGLYKKLNFSLIFPIDDKPVMLDDTSYLIPFDDQKSAIITWTYLNSDEVQKFMESITFLDTKRPYTKDTLMRISFHSILCNIDISKIHDFYIEELFNLTQIELKQEDFIIFKRSILSNENIGNEIKKVTNSKNDLKPRKTKKKKIITDYFDSAPTEQITTD